MTIIRPNDKAPLGASSGRLSIEWDKFFNDVQSTLNNLAKPLAFTFPAASSITIEDSRITATSFISWSATNAAAAALQLVISAQSPGSVTLSTANGAAAAGGETFKLLVSG